MCQESRDFSRFWSWLHLQQPILSAPALWPLNHPCAVGINSLETNLSLSLSLSLPLCNSPLIVFSSALIYDIFVIFWLCNASGNASTLGSMTAGNTSLFSRAMVTHVQLKINYLSFPLREKKGKGCQMFSLAPKVVSSLIATCKA